jgi:predicted dehydrogenase
VPGNVNQCNFASLLRRTQIIEAIYQSAQQGREVALVDVAGHV